jgi:hypothetical protein
MIMIMHALVLILSMLFGLPVQADQHPKPSGVQSLRICTSPPSSIITEKSVSVSIPASVDVLSHKHEYMWEKAGDVITLRLKTSSHGNANKKQRVILRLTLYIDLTERLRLHGALEGETFTTNGQQRGFRMAESSRGSTAIEFFIIPQPLLKYSLEARAEYDRSFKSDAEPVIQSLISSIHLVQTKVPSRQRAAQTTNGPGPRQAERQNTVPTSENAIQVAVFNYQIGHLTPMEGRHVKIAFLAVGNGKGRDPVPFVMKTVRSNLVIRPVSKASVSPGEVRDTSTGQAGVKLSVYEIKRRPDHSVLVKGEAFYKGKSGYLADYTLAFRNGQWKVTACVITEVS